MAILGDAASFPPEQFETMVAINIRGVFVAIQPALAHLGEGGRIINIGSINADRVPGPGLAVYAMTKAAVAGLTRGLARDLGPSGITVNNIQPGPIDTDMNPDRRRIRRNAAKQVMAGGQVRPTQRHRRRGQLSGGPRHRIHHRCALERRRRVHGLALTG